MFPLVASSPAFGFSLSYDIQPIDLGNGCFAAVGSEEYFSNNNGGFIVNTGFIVTDDGVVVIDSGPSKRFGEEFRQVINTAAAGTSVDRVIITHGHPDHYLGNQAFSDVPIYGGQSTIEMIKTQGTDFTVNMYRLVGDWMRGTESTAPDQILENSTFELGGHSISVIGYDGHTSEDFVVLDQTCGVLYAGDLVFNSRTLATPHADIALWRESLAEIAPLSFETLVPGHGEVSFDKKPIEQTDRYLEWLEQSLERAYRNGLDITEVMELEIAPEFADFSLARDEFQRTVNNLYPEIEADSLPVINATN